MLCSVRRSNWLDRLRSNKGFPPGDDLDLDLDHFLKRNPNSSSDSPNPNAESIPPVSIIPESSNPTEKGEALLGLMSTAISELFFIDGSEENTALSAKKVARKQTRPKVCVTSTSAIAIATTANDSNSSKEKRSSGSIGNGVHQFKVLTSLNTEKKNYKEMNEGEEELEEKGEKGERELEGYSKSEVTVIDTSCEVWKTEKVVFRRRNVWKVREKKGKVRSFGRNKRKSEEGDDGVEEKKKEVKVMECDGDQCISLNPIENSHDDTRKEVCKDTTDNLNDRGKEFNKDNMPDMNRKDLEKGSPLNRLPRKPMKDGSSVVFIKGIPTDERVEGKFPRKCLKDSQRRYKA